MPKLGGLIKKGDSGSTLVGAVVICAVMSIGIAGLMLNVRNTAGQEFGSLYDAEAFLAAESGLLTVTDLVAAVGANHLKIGGKYSLDKGGSASSVTVGIEKPVSGDRPGFVFTDAHLKLYSTVDHPNLPYDKRLEWIVELPPAGQGTLRKMGWREINKPK